MFLVRIDRFLRRSGMPPTCFGRASVGDPNLLEDIRRGRELGDGVAARIDRFLKERGV